jgi:hypothetical protein
MRGRLITKNCGNEVIMDKDIEEYCRQTTDYIIGRANAEGSIPVYFEQNHCNEITFWEFIYRIVTLSEEFFQFTEDSKEVFDSNDEYAYIAEKTGYSSTEIIELVIWFKHCYMMSYGGSTFVEECPECGHDELYEREVEGGDIYESYFECVKCGKEYSFEEILDMDEKLTIEANKEPNPLEGLNPDNLPVFTDKDATYLFRVKRQIIDLAGTDTLADLAANIQIIFDLNSERMSSFFMGKKYFESKHEISCPRFLPFDDDKPTSAEIFQICQLNLYEKQKFLYLHNFIAENRFTITFIGVR